MSGLGRQLGAVSGGLLLTFCGGIHIGWSIYHLNMPGNEWAVGITVQKYRFAVLSFFTGVVAALVLLGQVKDLLSNRIWLMASAFFFLINGVLFAILPINYVVTVTSRVVAGLGHGVAHTIMLIYSGEITLKQFRAKFIAILTASIIAGITVFSLISMVTTNHTYTVEPNMHPNRAFGIIIMPFSCIAGVLIFFFMVESPIHVLWRLENEALARQNLRILRNDPTKAESIGEEFNEIELLVRRTNSHPMENRLYYTEGNLEVFSFCGSLKVGNLLVFNYTMNMAKMLSVSAIFETTPVSHNWGPSILVLSKLVAAVIAIFSIDLLPRRFQYTISTFVTAALLVALAIMSETLEHLEPWIIPLMYTIAEVCSALGMLPMADILTSEVFPLPKKAILHFSNYYRWKC
ncbi:uncharacterized protein LOC129732447 isoform X2 [Wyeomyia smithii]|uniref:uncharacterized protein LOC129732447 isoform X2 n=1 Tax=Wyeomyia smithii TaxID=174621 RepID=UPI002467ACA4|nr:uncharacterized protein LOC129732447 isoform X2 [Wyeomyia smithii]